MACPTTSAPAATAAPRPRPPERALVAGWFSFPGNNSTFGDSRAMEVACRWLREAGMPFDVVGEPLNNVAGVNWETLDPAAYSIFVFVCGPWWGERAILERFGHCRRIGIGLSALGPGPLGFDVLIPRDGPDEKNPDLVMAARHEFLPVVGVALVHPQPEYGDRQRHAHVQGVVDGLVAGGAVAPLLLDTLLMHNPGRLTNADQFASLVRRTDVVVTTRLHGLVFALSCGVPAVAIDPIAGGAKVTAQARALGWPVILPGESLSPSLLEDSLGRCMAGDWAVDVERCRARAQEELRSIRARFVAALRGPCPSAGAAGGASAA